MGSILHFVRKLRSFYQNFANLFGFKWSFLKSGGAIAPLEPPLTTALYCQKNVAYCTFVMSWRSDFVPFSEEVICNSINRVKVSNVLRKWRQG